MEGAAVGMSVRNAIRQRIIDLCKANNITINKLSIVCAITQSTLNNIINEGSNNPTVSTIAKICDGLNMTVREFFDDELFDKLEQEIK